MNLLDKLNAKVAKQGGVNPYSAEEVIILFPRAARNLIKERAISELESFDSELSDFVKPNIRGRFYGDLTDDSTAVLVSSVMHLVVCEIARDKLGYTSPEDILKFYEMIGKRMTDGVIKSHLIGNLRHLAPMSYALSQTGKLNRQFNRVTAQTVKSKDSLRGRMTVERSSIKDYKDNLVALFGSEAIRDWVLKLDCATTRGSLKAIGNAYGREITIHHHQCEADHYPGCIYNFEYKPRWWDKVLAVISDWFPNPKERRRVREIILKSTEREMALREGVMQSVERQRRIAETKALLRSLSSHDTNNHLLGIGGNAQLYSMQNDGLLTSLRKVSAYLEGKYDVTREKALLYMKKAMVAVAEQAKYFEAISESVDYIIRGHKQLKEAISMLENVGENDVRVDISDTVDEILREGIKASKVHTAYVRIEKRIEYPEIITNSMILESAIRNFVYNAVEAIMTHNKDEKGKIIIGSKKTNEKVTVYVQDDGPGVDPGLKKFLMERYVKSTKETGSGMGLATLKNLCDIYGAEIGFESEHGKGSTFYITVKDKK